MALGEKSRRLKSIVHPIKTKTANSDPLLLLPCIQMMSKENPFSRHCRHLFTQTEFYFSPEREGEKRERKRKQDWEGKTSFVLIFFLHLERLKILIRQISAYASAHFFSRCVQVAYHHFTIAIIQYL